MPPAAFKFDQYFLVYKQKLCDIVMVLLQTKVVSASELNCTENALQETLL